MLCCIFPHILSLKPGRWQMHFSVFSGSWFLRSILFFYRRKWYLEAQTGCPAARPDCEPPPNAVKWLKLIQDPESTAVFFFPPPCSSSFRRLQEKKRGTQWFPSGVSQTQTDFQPCETISKCVLCEANSVHVQNLRRWTWRSHSRTKKKKDLRIKIYNHQLCIK